jgi:hypothetical protein
VIDGGAVHSADNFRSLAHMLSGGKSGVAEGGDLAVKQQTVAAGSVKVLAGNYVIKNTYPGALSQSYVGRVLSDTTVNIAPTSGSIRSDMIVMRIDDPQFGGSTPPSVPNGPYAKLEVLSNVGAGVTEVPSGLGYPAIPLARIDIPVSTTNITAGMIKDIRKLARPRRERQALLYQPTSDQLLSAVNPTYEDWPKTGGWDVAVPDWASALTVIAHMAGIDFETPGGAGKTLVRFGVDGSAVQTQTTQYDTASVGGASRQVLLAAGSLVVPTSYKGTTQKVTLRGTLTTGTGTTRPVADIASTIVLDVEFVEALYIP